MAFQNPFYSKKQPNIGGLHGYEVESFLLQHIQNFNLKRRGRKENDAPDLRFASNEEFWNSLINSDRVALRWVELRHFQIVDWFPRTPGLYHTETAQYARKEAQNHIVEENNIRFYDPQGKHYMIEGGIGSVRFKPIVINNEDYWLCTATTDGYCHTGIPLAIPNTLINSINMDRNYAYKITGLMKFLPDFIEQHFYHMRGIPQIYIMVDNIKQMGKDEFTPVFITPMVFFTITEEKGRLRRENVTYFTCSSNKLSELNKATDWFEWYSRKFKGEIITNFDQQRPTFQNAPFSLQNVMNGRIDRYRLEELHIYRAEIICDTIERIQSEEMTMSKIEVNIGDGTIITGDFVVAHSIKDSFNKASIADISNDLKDLLKSLVKEVGKISDKLPEEKAKEVARDLETLTAEATSKTPRKKWWQLSVEGLKQMAKDVGEIGKPILEIISKIVPLLS